MITAYQTVHGEGHLIWNEDYLIEHHLPGSPAVDIISKPVETRSATNLAAMLEAYFRGQAVAFDINRLPIDWSTYSEFGLNVVRALAQVPYGKTITYASLASAAGYPQAYRAVGSLMARNHFPILLPCHRVIRSDGQIGQFSSGEDWKSQLQGLEADAITVSLSLIP